MCSEISAKQQRAVDVKLVNILVAEMGARTDDGRAKYLVLPMIVACMSASLAT